VLLPFILSFRRRELWVALNTQNTSISIVEPETRSALYRAHPLVRIESADGAWLLGREDRISGHKVPARVAAIVVAAFEPGTVDQFVELLHSVNEGIRQVESILLWLIRNEYLVPEDDDDAIKTAHWLDSWAKNGWRAASHYHARTYGYPFETYEVDGSCAEDFRRMSAYNAERPDVERARPRMLDAKRSYAIPEPSEDLFPMQASDAMRAAGDEQPLDYERLAAFLSLLTRPVRVGKMPFPEAADLLRKTSPSGGSRHPTEFYIATQGVVGVDDGIYQVAPVDGVFDSLDRLAGDQRPWVDAAGLSVGDHPWAIVLFSSYFARNRYRYREPRTFRTVHMDVGHLMGTAEYLGLAHGWTVRHAQHIDSAKIASMLGVDRHVESPIAATLLHQAR
jgi:SagB-type dehydrogenase family enzyme